MNTANREASRDYFKLLAYLNFVAMAVRLGQFRPTAEQRSELGKAISYLGDQLKKQLKTPAVEQPAPRRPSIIQQGEDIQADFLRAANKEIR